LSYLVQERLLGRPVVAGTKVDMNVMRSVISNTLITTMIVHPPPLLQIAPPVASSNSVPPVVRYKVLVERLTIRM
jgi:hypothetical protein